MDYPYFGGANDREHALAVAAFDDGFTNVHTWVLEPLASEYICGISEPLRCPCAAWLTWEQLGEEIWHDVETAWDLLHVYMRRHGPLPTWDAYDWLRWGVVALWHADHPGAPMEIPDHILPLMPAAGELIAKEGGDELKRHFRMYERHARAAAREYRDDPSSALRAGLYDNFPDDWRSIPRPPDDRGALLYSDRLFCIEDGEALVDAMQKHGVAHDARWLPGGRALRFPMPMFCGAASRCVNAIESPVGPIGTLIGADLRSREIAHHGDRTYKDRMEASYREGWGHQMTGTLSDGGAALYHALTVLPPTALRFYELSYALTHYRNDVSLAWSEATEAHGREAPCIHRAYFSGDMPPGLALARYQPNLEAW